MPNPSTRMHVYVAINEERDYQDKKHGDHRHSISEWITLIDAYLVRTKAYFAGGKPDCETLMLAEIRKIAATAVVCMEQNGIVGRDDGAQPVCDVCGDTEEQHKTQTGYESETKRRADLVKKLNEEFTPAGDAALLKLKSPGISTRVTDSNVGPGEPIILSDFRKDIENTINRYSKENGSNTPDFILAQYLVDCLGAYDKAVTAREKWYGRDLYGIEPGAIVHARKSAEPVPPAPAVV